MHFINYEWNENTNKHGKCPVYDLRKTAQYPRLTLGSPDYLGYEWILNFLVARLGYQLLKLGSLTHFLVASGYQATTKSYTGVWYYEYSLSVLVHTLEMYEI